MWLQRKHVCSIAGAKQCILFFETSALILFVLCNKKTLGQQVFDFAVNAMLTFKNDKVKIALHVKLL